MDDLFPHEPRDPRLPTDEGLRSHLEFLLQRANLRQLWLIFLGDDRIVGPLMPSTSLPPDPDELHETEDLGALPFPEVLSHRLPSLVDAVGADAMVFVWERPGGEGVGREDGRWARGMADGCRARGIRIRAQFLLHDGGLRPLVPDDYL